MKSYKKGFTVTSIPYIKSTVNYTIICPVHGEFFKRPDSHTNLKQGCSKCSKREHLKWFTKDVDSLVQDKSFSYVSENDFVYKKTRLKFFCNIHNENFFRSIRDIELGCGCPKCDKIVFKEQQRLKRKLEFIEKANIIHNNQYGYVDIDYRGAFEPIKIYCKACQEYFLQKPRDHIQGNGCQTCGILKAAEKRTYTLSTFLEKVKDLYTDVDYSELEFTSLQEEGKFICKKHGPYYQKIGNHLRYKGCEECGKESIKEAIQLSSEEFFNRVSNKEFYNFSKSVYNGLREEIEVWCNVHDEYFTTTPYSLLYRQDMSSTCPKCQRKNKSLKEFEIIEFFKSKQYNVIHSYRPPWLGRKEIDIYFPDYNLGIEYNGSVTHHSNVLEDMFYDNRRKPSTYHLDKYNICKENNVELIHIFEFEDLDSWYVKILDYLENPDKFVIAFQNTKRSSDVKGVLLEYYGISRIKPLNTL